MKLSNLPRILRNMIRVEAGCWYPYNQLGKPQKQFWDEDAQLSTPIATFVWRLNGGECDKGARFARTCGHRDCVNPDHMTLADSDFRLTLYIDQREPDKCWLWTSAVNGDGYGVIAKDGAQVKAHRAAYEQAHGPIPPGLLVRHLCNNKLCCNPAHLATGTTADNAADSVAAGVSKRMGRHAGDREKAAAAVQAVRRGMRIGEAAALHSVTRVTIWRNMRRNK